jgi:hypothetical protein
MLPHQSLQSWQQAPMQGAVPAPQQETPFTTADEAYLQETLVYCRVRLESALSTAQRYNRLPDLTVAVADALTSCNQALSVVNDPQTYLE